MTDMIRPHRPRAFALIASFSLCLSLSAQAAPIVFDPLDNTETLMTPGAYGDDLKQGTEALASGDSVAAQAAFMRALSRRPDDVVALLGVASSMQLRGERLAALNWTLRAIKQQPTDAKVLEAHTRLSLENGDLPAAIERVRSIVSAHPAAVPPGQALGRLYLLDRQPAKAVDELTRVVELPGSDATARVDLGKALLSAGRADEAVSVLDQVRAEMPGSSLALSPLARAEFARARPEIALAHLTSLEGLTSMSASDYVLKGDVLSALSRHQDAADAYARAADTGPADTLLALKHAQALDRAGRGDEALAAYEDVLARDADNLVALNNAAFLSATRRLDLDKALERAQRSLRVGGEQAALYDTLATVQIARGDTEAARQSLQQALKLDPGHASARERLANLTSEAAPAVAGVAQAAPARTVESPAEPATPRASDVMAPVATAASATAAAPPEEEAPVTAAPAAPERAVEPVDAVQDQADLSDALERWRMAWQGEQYNAYVDAYVADTSPIAGMSRKRWEQDRQRKLSKPGRLEITIESVEWTRIDDDTWMSRFVQHYASSNYRDKSLKTLTWSRRDGQWRIESEAAKTL
ncbi:tetratricopeptide repeat protein [Nitrogeniibacter aestuarii]|uniref:tetratricopeptide repeat protein n=1 Tax=Nitrogeniibacter aestuarii TaxID=2815343 RepID=UPI001E296318|nr:tetratricopeptide repeat protein [Nitrogeniibacter aestuarii]